MNKVTNEKTKKKQRDLEIIALIFAIISLTIGFLAFSSQLKIQSELNVHKDHLTFKVVFSSEQIKEAKDPIEPTITGTGVTAQKAIINNLNNPVITNLSVNFTEPGQKVKYSFYVYNAGEYTAYLNGINYKNIGNSNTSKLCMTRDGQITETIKNACNNIKITVDIADITTSKTLLNINNRFLRPRTAQPIEVIIEYLDNGQEPNESFDVFFGNIELYYSNTSSSSCSKCQSNSLS